MSLDEQAKKILTWGLLLAVVIFLISAYVHFFILKKMHYPKNEAMKNTYREEIKDCQKQLREIQQAEAQKDKIEEMRKVVAEAAKRLPSTPDAAGFYNELIRILRITGVLTKRVEPKANRGQTLYTEIPYGIENECRYHEFGQFLNLIEENQTRFMRVNSFDIKNNQQRPSIHPVTVNISTFMFNR